MSRYHRIELKVPHCDLSEYTEIYDILLEHCKYFVLCRIPMKEISDIQILRIFMLTNKRIRQLTLYNKLYKQLYPYDVRILSVLEYKKDSYNTDVAHHITEMGLGVRPKNQIITGGIITPFIQEAIQDRIHLKY